MLKIVGIQLAGPYLYHQLRKGKSLLSLLMKSIVPGAHKRHEVAQRSVKLAWITGSNCCQTRLCAFYHLRIVLITEAIVHLQGTHKCN